MRLRTRIGTFVAAVCIVGAIGAAPASAAGPSFNISSLGALCKSIKDVKVENACIGATKNLDTSKTSDLKGLIDKYGKSFNGVNANSIQKLLASFGGSGGIDISKILSGLGGSGGLDLSKLLGGLKF